VPPLPSRPSGIRLPLSASAAVLDDTPDLLLPSPPSPSLAARAKPPQPSIHPVQIGSMRTAKAPWGKVWGNGEATFKEYASLPVTMMMQPK